MTEVLSLFFYNLLLKYVKMWVTLYLLIMLKIRKNRDCKSVLNRFKIMIRKSEHVWTVIEMYAEYTTYNLIVFIMEFLVVWKRLRAPIEFKIT